MPLIQKRAKAGPIGVDIGAAAVKLLQLTEKDGQPALVAAACQEFSGDDQSAREAAMAQFIDKALRQGGFQGRQAVCALGHGEYQMKNIRLPRMPEEDLAMAVEFEAKERFDTGGAPAQFRHVIAGEVRHGNELKEELIVFAASDEVVQRRLSLMESLNLTPLAIDLAPCAMARSFIRFLRRAEDANSVNVFVDIGRRGSAILITRGTDMAFLKIIETGGKSMTAAAAENLGISEEEAADLRIRIMREQVAPHREDAGSTVQPDVRSAIGDAIRPVAERISKDLQLCLRYYAVTFRGHRPDSITLVGGEAHEPILSKTISESIDIPCIVGYPLRGVAGAAALPRVERSYQPAWAVACGLALRDSKWVATRRPAAVAAV